MIVEKEQTAGTARLLHEIAEYEELEREYGEAIAISVTTKAAQKADPSIVDRDTRGAVKFVRAVRTGKVCVATERQEVEDRAARAAGELLAAISSCQAELQD